MEDRRAGGGRGPRTAVPGRGPVSSRGALTATVAARGGSYVLTVRRRGRRVLESPLARVDPRGRPQAGEDTLDDAYATPAGKRRRHVIAARRLTLTLPRGRTLQ